MLLTWHSVLWLSLGVMDTHPSAQGDTQQSGCSWASSFPKHTWWDAAGEDVARILSTPPAALWPVAAQMLAASFESQLILISFREGKLVSWEQKVQKNLCSVTIHVLGLAKTVPGSRYPLALLVSLRVWDALMLKQQGEVRLCPGPRMWHRQMCPGCTVPPACSPLLP